MVNTSHIIIPFASSLDASCKAAIQNLALPHLSRFMQNSEVVHTSSGDEFDFMTPHERLIGLTEQVVITPCHWSVGIDHIRMDNPDDLALTEPESRALLSAALPYFEGDGIPLTYSSPQRWLVQGEALSRMALQGVLLASLDRVIGRNVDVWQPQSEASKAVRRLQNEIQMLLYTHPINDAREARGLPTVNSFWLSYAANDDARSDYSLRSSALRADWYTWVQDWQTLDSKLGAAVQNPKLRAHITFCGERHSATYAIPSNLSFVQKVKRLVRPKPSIHLILQDL